jgi:hypothetical protein
VLCAGQDGRARAAVTVAASGWWASAGHRERIGRVLAELGVIAPQGLRNVSKLIAIVRDKSDALLPDFRQPCQ